MLSIITITKNDLPGLTDTIKSTSILRNSFLEIEQIIVDGSDKELLDKNLELIKDESKLTHIQREPKGISDAFNFGIEKSKYDWVWFLNGGDIFNEAFDIEVLKYIIKNAQTNLIIFQIGLKKDKTLKPHPTVSRISFPFATWIPHPGTIIQRRLFDKFGFFDEKLSIAMDYEYWLRVFTNDIRINLISIPIAYYDTDGISSKAIERVSREGYLTLQGYKWTIIRKALGVVRDLYSQISLFKKRSN